MVIDIDNMIVTIARYGAYIAFNATREQADELVKTYLALLLLGGHQSTVNILLWHPNGLKYVELILSGYSVKHACRETNLLMILPKVSCTMPEPYPGFFDECQKTLTEEVRAIHMAGFR